MRWVGQLSTLLLLLGGWGLSTTAAPASMMISNIDQINYEWLDAALRSRDTGQALLKELHAAGDAIEPSTLTVKKLGEQGKYTSCIPIPTQ